MNIEFGSYVIKADTSNFILTRKYVKKKDGVETGEIGYVDVSYHMSLKSALKKILTFDIKGEDVRDIDSAINRIEIHEKMLDELYDDLSDVLKEMKDCGL